MANLDFKSIHFETAKIKNKYFKTEHCLMLIDKYINKYHNCIKIGRLNLKELNITATTITLN